MIQSHIFLAAGWVLYFFIHSLLASNRVKSLIEEKWPGIYKWYRIIYNLIALAGFATLFHFSFHMQSKDVLAFLGINLTMTIFWFGLLIMVVGLGIIKIAFNTYSFKKFAGLKDDSNEPFETSGLLQHVRHPLYSGTIIALTGFWLEFPTIANGITILMSIIYIFIGIRLEEAKLKAHYGKQYEDYQKKTPMLFPKLFKN